MQSGEVWVGVREWRGGGRWEGSMCSDGRRLWAPSCHRHPGASSPLIWEKNTWCHQRDADWIQMWLPGSFHVFNEGAGIESTFSSLLFPPDSLFLPTSPLQCQLGLKEVKKERKQRKERRRRRAPLPQTESLWVKVLHLLQSIHEQKKCANILKVTQRYHQNLRLITET